MEANEEDKSPDIKAKTIRKIKKADIINGSNENFNDQPYYLDKEKVKSRLYGTITNNSSSVVDWKNLDKLTKNAIDNADMPIAKLLTLSHVLGNEIVRLAKLDVNLKKEIKLIPKMKDLKYDLEK
jgi:hypothetical protein